MLKDDHRLFLNAERKEITAQLIYAHFAQESKTKKNKRILEQIAVDEARHYQFWKEKTGTDVRPNKITLYWYFFIAHVFGLSFGLKLMEKGELLSIKFYQKYKNVFPKLALMEKDEVRHEKVLLSRLDEQKLVYASSIILGLNDALVELTGVLAGLTFALQQSKLIAMVGFITGFAASLSMTASGYLSSKEDSNKNGRTPLTSALYTGCAYVITVLLLVFPYFLFSNIYASLGVMLSIALMIILSYTFYIATAKSLSFWKRFAEMALISLGVALFSFIIGWMLRNYVGI